MMWILAFVVSEKFEKAMYILGIGFLYLQIINKWQFR